MSNILSFFLRIGSNFLISFSVWICFSCGCDAAVTSLELLPASMLPTLAWPRSFHPPCSSKNFLASSSSSPSYHTRRGDIAGRLRSTTTNISSSSPLRCLSLSISTVTKSTLYQPNARASAIVLLSGLARAPCLLPAQSQPHRVRKRRRPLQQNPI